MLKGVFVMEETKVDFNMYLEAYGTVEKKRREYDLKDLKDLNPEITDLQERIKHREDMIQEFTQERIDELNEKNGEKKSFEEYTASYMEDIRKSQEKIEQFKEEIKKQEEVRKEYADKFEQLQGHKDTIHMNAKKEKEQKVALLEGKLQNEMLEEELSQLQNQYDEIIKQEENDPKYVRDKRYKQFLMNKIQSKKEEINQFQMPIKKQIKEINDGYRNFLKNLVRIDHAKKIEDIDYIMHPLERQKQDKLNRNRVQDPEQAYDEAVKEEERRKLDELNKRRVQRPEEDHPIEDLYEEEGEIEDDDFEDYDEYHDDFEDYDEEEEDEYTVDDFEDDLEEDEYDELNRNRVQDPDEAWKLAIREEERRKLASEADKKYKDAQIIIGRKGKIVFDGVTYKIPKRAIKEGYNFNEYDIEDIFSNYEDIEQGELVTSIIRQGLVEPAVINLIDKSSMDEFNKEELIKRYIDYVKNIYNATSKDEASDIIKNRPFCLKYDLEDISKTNIISRIAGNEINEEEKFKINKIAYDANRCGMCEIIGEGYKPNWVSRLTALVTRKDIKRLPTLGEQQVVAEKYNELREKGQTSEITRMGFREELKVPPEVQTENGKKAENLNSVQIAELIHLHESQTAQEKDDEER